MQYTVTQYELIKNRNKMLPKFRKENEGIAVKKEKFPRMEKKKGKTVCRAGQIFD